LVGRVVRGKLLFRRQTLPQAEPIAAERTAVMVIMRFEMLFTDDIGWSRMLLNLGIESAKVTVVRNRASGGTERRI
jgi:hypothetical protein